VDEDLVGKPFPDWTMKDDMGREVRLSDQWREGTVLLLFFSSAFGFICNLEFLTFKAMHKVFIDANCRIFGVSNNSTRSLGAYSENLGIPFPLLCDEGTRLSQLLGTVEAIGGPWEGFTLRSEFIIDRNGIVRYVHIPPDSNYEPDYDTILAEVRKLA